VRTLRASPTASARHRHRMPANSTAPRLSGDRRLDERSRAPPSAMARMLRPSPPATPNLRSDAVMHRGTPSRLKSAARAGSLTAGKSIRTRAPGFAAASLQLPARGPQPRPASVSLGEARSNGHSTVVAHEPAGRPSRTAASNPNVRIAGKNRSREARGPRFRRQNRRALAAVKEEDAQLKTPAFDTRNRSAL